MTRSMTDSQLEELLEYLALQAQQNPLQSIKRQQILHEMISLIQHFRKLKYPDGKFDIDLYEDAKQNLWRYLYENIEKYNPVKGSVIAWVNFLLLKRYYPKAIATEAKQKEIAIEIIKSSKSSNHFSATEKQALSLQELIISDPDKVFQERYIKSHPQANFQKLTELRLAGYFWKEISEEIGVDASTLRRFYSRCFREFKLLLQQYLSD